MVKWSHIEEETQLYDDCYIVLHFVKIEKKEIHAFTHFESCHRISNGIYRYQLVITMYTAIQVQYVLHVLVHVTCISCPFI